MTSHAVLLLCAGESARWHFQYPLSDRMLWNFQPFRTADGNYRETAWLTAI